MTSMFTFNFMKSLDVLSGLSGDFIQSLWNPITLSLNLQTYSEIRSKS